MSKKSERVEERERLERLGEHLRDCALSAYVGANRLHDDPRWRAVPEYGLAAWTAIVEAALKAGWKPPPDQMPATLVEEIRQRLERDTVKGVVMIALASADYLGGTLMDKADRISGDVVDGLAREVGK